MILEPDDPRRKDGAVFLDETLAAGPAAHVLVIGVGDYRSAKLRLVTSTTVSARAVADWFVGTVGGARFRNPGCPLGSLAILLSEPAGAGGAAGTYAGGAVPRADFAGAKAAVRAWVTRINANKDNMAVLYVASHGESFLGRTAFLLEDFGLDPLDATAGMSEIEQFVSALENAAPVAQFLLFDCCRTPADVKLPWNTEFGTKLIALTRSENDHGEPRKQWVIAATSVGEAATGRTGRTTLFAEALIDALNGVAGNTTQDGWPVRPGMLLDQVSSLLSLHRLPEEKAQTPGGRMAGSFDITLPGERPEVPVYISLADPADWPDSSITVETGAGTVTIEGEENQAPFWKRNFLLNTEIKVAVRRNGAEIGRATRKAGAPALFLQVKKEDLPSGTVVGRLPEGRSFGRRAVVVVAVESPVHIEAGAVADIVRRDEPARNPKRFTVALGGEARQEVATGEYVVTLTTPDGRVQKREITVADGEIVKVEFATQASPHEWLAGAAATGSLAPASESPPEEPAATDEPGSIFGGLVRDLTEKIGKVIAMTDILQDRVVMRKTVILPRFPGGWRRDGGSDVDRAFPEAETADFAAPEAEAEIAGFLDAELGLRAQAGPGLEATIRQDDGRFLRIDFRDEEDFRQRPERGGREARPPCARVRAAGRGELVVLPVLGGDRSRPDGDWNPYVVVDRLAPPGTAMSTAVVEDRRWAGLLGFLALRDMAAAAEILNGVPPELAIEALVEKRRNPLAALAGALVAVAVSSPDLERKWDPWLVNLADWFPGIPDGPIVLGRRLLTRARNAEGIAAAKARFVEGFDRGAPVYSLCADWLARGLESIADDDPAFVARRRAARRLADRTDSTKTFTVIRDDD